jgi:hypothetical protein
MINPKTQIELYPKMRVLKKDFPSYREGGFTWEEYTYIGQLETKNRYKYGRENELFELIKDLKEPD